MHIMKIIIDVLYITKTGLRRGSFEFELEFEFDRELSTHTVL